MRRLASLAALLGALVLAAPAAADPGDVYVDYASDGTLSCGHSRADLEGILTDASLNEYGDPLTLLRLKLAVRRQLNGGCQPGAGGAVEPASEAPSAASGGAEPLTEGGDAAPSPVEAGSAEGTDTVPATTGEAPSVEAPPVSSADAGASSADEPTASEETPETVAVAAAHDDDDGGETGAPAAPLILALGAGAAALAAGGLLARRALTRGG